MFARLAVLLRLRALGRRDGLDDRATVLSLFARFTDELCSGLLVIVMPVLRSRLGLTVAQVGWCFQALSSAGAVVEPLSGAAIDLARRRPLLVFGAAAWGTALLLAARAPTYGWLLTAFAFAGVAYGPLANTADVVLVEAHPDAVERIAGRSTALDTLGALLAPAGVAVAAWANVDEGVLLAGAGAGALGYALLLAGTALPDPAGGAGPAPAWARMTANLRAVLSDRQARTWMGALLLVEAFDVPEVFEPLWLRDVVGVPQALVAVHVGAGLAAGLVALVVADRWLATHDAEPLVVASCLAALVVYPAWLLAPGFAAKLPLVILRDAALAPLWPILHVRALAAVPGKAGAVSALTALLALLPLHAAFGWVAGRLGLTTTMLVVQVAATLAVLALLPRPRAGTR